MAGGLAIVLSGGAKGAFQVGVLDELITHRGVNVDIVAGVSTGAIQALGVAQGDMPGLIAAWLALRGRQFDLWHAAHPVADQSVRRRNETSPDG